MIIIPILIAIISAILFFKGLKEATGCGCFAFIVLVLAVMVLLLARIL